MQAKPKKPVFSRRVSLSNNLNFSKLPAKVNSVNTDKEPQEPLSVKAVEDNITLTILSKQSSNLDQDIEAEENLNNRLIQYFKKY